MVELNTFDRGQYLDHDRRSAHAEESVTVEKIVGEAANAA
jgi:hypothetical protein